MAYSLNRAQIIGNMTRDPELRKTPSGTSVAGFSIATNHAWTDANGQKIQYFMNITMKSGAYLFATTKNNLNF